MKLKLLRDDIGCCICEDCGYYDKVLKVCKQNRKSADSASECKNFFRSYGIVGNKEGD